MAKPKWFRKSLAYLSIILYSGDVGSDFWVGIDLVRRCHYRYAASVFAWIVIPGFVQGWMEFFRDDQEYTLFYFAKALFFPIILIPITLYRLVQAALDIDDEEKMNYAKV